MGRACRPGCCRWNQTVLFNLFHWQTKRNTARCHCMAPFNQFFAGQTGTLWSCIDEIVFVFDHVVTTLQNWEGSPFGRDLKEDLNKLPARKRDEYIHGFKTFLRFPHKAMRYLCIIYNIACRSRAQSETLEELEDFPPFMQDLFASFCYRTFRTEDVWPRRSVISGDGEACQTPTSKRGWSAWAYEGSLMEFDPYVIYLNLMKHDSWKLEICFAVCFSFGVWILFEVFLFMTDSLDLCGSISATFPSWIISGRTPRPMGSWSKTHHFLQLYAYMQYMYTIHSSTSLYTRTYYTYRHLIYTHIIYIHILYIYIYYIYAIFSLPAQWSVTLRPSTWIHAHIYKI